MGRRKFKRPLLLSDGRIDTDGDFVLDAQRVLVSNDDQQGSGSAILQILAKDGTNLQEIYFADRTVNGDFFDISSPSDGSLELWSKPPGESWRLSARLVNGNVVVRGDEDTALAVTGASTSTVDRSVILYGTALTEARAITLSTTNAFEGMTWRIVRQTAATGAFDLDVGGLKDLATADEWCDVTFDGSAWVLTAAGSL